MMKNKRFPIVITPLFQKKYQNQGNVPLYCSKKSYTKCPELTEIGYFYKFPLTPDTPSKEAEE